MCTTTVGRGRGGARPLTAAAFLSGKAPRHRGQLAAPPRQALPKSWRSDSGPGEPHIRWQHTGSVKSGVRSGRGTRRAYRLKQHSSSQHHAPRSAPARSASCWPRSRPGSVSRSGQRVRDGRGPVRRGDRSARPSPAAFRTGPGRLTGMTGTFKDVGAARGSSRGALGRPGAVRQQAMTDGGQR